LVESGVKALDSGGTKREGTSREGRGRKRGRKEEGGREGRKEGRGKRTDATEEAKGEVVECGFAVVLSGSSVPVECFCFVLWNTRSVLVAPSQVVFSAKVEREMSDRISDKGEERREKREER